MRPHSPTSEPADGQRLAASPLPDPTPQFEGVWIPRLLWWNRDIPWLSKMLLVQIRSLSNDPEGRGCWASDRYLAEFFDCSADHMGRLLRQLERGGWIARSHVAGAAGRRRFLTLTPKAAALWHGAPTTANQARRTAKRPALDRQKCRPETGKNAAHEESHGVVQAEEEEEVVRGRHVPPSDPPAPAAGDPPPSSLSIEASPDPKAPLPAPSVSSPGTGPGNGADKHPGPPHSCGDPLLAWFLQGGVLPEVAEELLERKPRAWFGFWQRQAQKLAPDGPAALLLALLSDPELCWFVERGVPPAIAESVLARHEREDVRAWQRHAERRGKADGAEFVLWGLDPKNGQVPPPMPMPREGAPRPVRLAPYRPPGRKEPPPDPAVTAASDAIAQAERERILAKWAEEGTRLPRRGAGTRSDDPAYRQVRADVEERERRRRMGL
jgi:DNA-binding MarR family transcriptional regulator